MKTQICTYMRTKVSVYSYMCMQKYDWPPSLSSIALPRCINAYTAMLLILPYIPICIWLIYAYVCIRCYDCHRIWPVTLSYSIAAYAPIYPFICVYILMIPAYIPICACSYVYIHMYVYACCTMIGRRTQVSLPFHAQSLYIYTRPLT